MHYEMGFSNSTDCKTRTLASPYPSVRPYGTAWSPLNGFSWNFMWSVFT